MAPPPRRAAIHHREPTLTSSQCPGLSVSLVIIIQSSQTNLINPVRHSKRALPRELTSAAAACPQKGTAAGGVWGVLHHLKAHGRNTDDGGWMEEWMDARIKKGAEKRMDDRPHQQESYTARPK